MAWLGWEKTSRIGQDRRTGWQDAMRAAGLDVTGLAVRISDNVDAARMAAHQLLDDTSVTGFVCASDTLAIGVLHALAERGLRPGADIGVVGFDDSLAAQVTWPGLTSVRQPLEQVAEELVRSCTSCSPTSRSPSAAGCSSPPSSYVAPASASPLARREGSHGDPRSAQRGLLVGAAHPNPAPDGFGPTRTARQRQ